MVLIASCYTVLDALGPGVQSRHLVLPDQPLPPPPSPDSVRGIGFKSSFFSPS